MLTGPAAWRRSKSHRQHVWLRRSCRFCASICACSACSDPKRGSPITLALANIALAVAQFVEPVLFGHIVDALSGALPAGMWPAAHVLAPLIGAWVGFGLFIIVAGGVGGVVRRPPRAPPPQPGAGGLFRARTATAARLSCRRAFRPADEDHAHRHRHAVVAVGVVLPRAFRRFRLYRRAAAGVADLELAAGAAVARRCASVSRC